MGKQVGMTEGREEEEGGEGKWEGAETVAAVCYHLHGQRCWLLTIILFSAEMIFPSPPSF